MASQIEINKTHKRLRKPEDPIVNKLNHLFKNSPQRTSIPLASVALPIAQQKCLSYTSFYRNY